MITDILKIISLLKDKPFFDKGGGKRTIMSDNYAIRILEIERHDLEIRKANYEYQQRRLAEIEAMDIDEDLKHGRIIRYVGDPVYFNQKRLDQINNAISILNKQLN